MSQHLDGFSLAMLEIDERLLRAGKQQFSDWGIDEGSLALVQPPLLQAELLPKSLDGLHDALHLTLSLLHLLLELGKLLVLERL
mmetsp:Transcript_38640/g.91582  ORF Transcript_38640/g.91582 Transcript_38640/m.91582 type:complete len:84 (+) Transcript_38640:179-430(+)